MSKAYFQNVTQASGGATRDNLTSFAASKVGMNYVWGGTSDAGYDCSGLIYKAYESQGISIPRVAQGQYDASTKIGVNQLRPGDSVFFSDTGSTSNVTHTGMYIGNGQYIHAANRSDGIIVSTLNTNGSYFVGGGRLLNDGGNGGTPISSNLVNAMGSLNGGSSGAIVSTGSGVISSVNNINSSGGMTYAKLLAFNAANNPTGSIGSIGSTVATGSAGSNIVVGEAARGSAPDAWAATGNYVIEETGIKQKILIIIGHILKFITLLGIFVLACVLFMKAFDIKKPQIL